ncbi:MAG: hypothetical protein ACJAWS_003040 [Oleiphilaceae bacterium]|jgi:hypothetical protein
MVKPVSIYSEHKVFSTSWFMLVFEEKAKAEVVGMTANLMVKLFY